MSHLSIQTTVSRFANCLDHKDWHGLSLILTDTIECDYQALRGITESCDKQHFIELRKSALSPLNTQHIFSNYDIELNVNNIADCKVSALILRKNEQDQYFNTHAFYQFQLVQIAEQWLIRAIKQQVFWNEGDPSIHSGVTED